MSLTPHIMEEDRILPIPYMLRVANNYLQGEESAMSAVERLSRYGAYGEYMSGEIMLDQASTVDSWSASCYISHARTYYLSAASKHSRNFAHADSKHRALMRLPQLEAYEKVFVESILPSAPVVTDMYHQLLDHAVSVASQNNPHEANIAKDMASLQKRGVIAEMAVLLLGQRLALNYIGCDSWLPLQSQFREDSGGACSTEKTRPAIDNVVYTQKSRNDPIEQTYELQVKRSLAGKIIGSCLTNMYIAAPTVYVHPDLAIYYGEPRVSEHIIEECAIEAQGLEGSVQASSRLNERSEKLLNFYD